MFYLAIWKEPYEVMERFAEEAAAEIRLVIDRSPSSDRNALVAVWHTFDSAVQQYGSLARDADRLCVRCGAVVDLCNCVERSTAQEN
jgi:hypothetical protein